MNRLLERLIERHFQYALLARLLARRRALLKRARKIDDAHGQPRTKQAQSLHRIPKLPNVARPIEPLKRANSNPPQPRWLHAVEGRKLRDELICERRDVSGAIAE